MDVPAAIFLSAPAFTVGILPTATTTKPVSVLQTLLLKAITLYSVVTVGAAKG